MRLPLILASLIIVMFLTFQPRSLNYLSPHARTSYLNHFLNQTISTHYLDPQKYWETREFYFPGVFYVFQDGLTDQSIHNFSVQTGLALSPVESFPILIYQSPKWHSYESLVNTNQLSDLINLPNLTPLYQDSQTKIYQDGNLTYFFFIKPYDELKTTNGFIYTKEHILQDYQYWFGVSVVTR